MANKTIFGLAAGLCAAGSAFAGGTVVISGDITTSQTWTADNIYDLQGQVYVVNGATLTIEAGTLVQSTTSKNGSGSLAITRGAQIFVQGTKDAPVIMTSSNDDLVTYRQSANEWGNLTIMGNGFIGAGVDVDPANTDTPNANNRAPMEGLVPDFAGDPSTLYGGGNDDDDSGSIEYLSLRYGGRVVGLNNELNGLSLGGIGRGTDICAVEIMNNVDDGIEIWGGTVNLKYFSIWNVGDDSLDIDQGWRGKAQFGLIVQGYSVDANQGSGVGDNAIEMDGAEDSDAQPVTTGVMYNMTVIGQPLDGDGLTTWRDGARMQFRNSIFMDGGEQLVKFDNLDGDGANGYGHNGTTAWADLWNTPFDSYEAVNAPANPGSLYQAQVDGRMIEITDSIFFRNISGSAYTEADARGVRDAANNNTTLAFDDPSPIAGITRGPLFVSGGQGKEILPVVSLDPRATNAATTSVDTAPDDGFFTPAAFRGAFAPDMNWLCGWTAADAYGFVVQNDCFEGDLCPDPVFCLGDVDGDQMVGFGDLVQVLAFFGTPNSQGDADGDGGEVDFQDITAVLAAFGSTCE